MIDLKTKPFYLKDEDIAWVEDTIASMSLEEKIGQLFINLDTYLSRERMAEIFEKYHIGGCRYGNKSPEEIWEQNKFYQEHSKIPLLIAANCDNGGDGACQGGTLVASAAACGASLSTEESYHAGLVSGAEGTALGCNWTFGPVLDILFNWRNTIVNTRAYSDSEDVVLRNAMAYMKGVWNAPMAVCGKHFPGDGVEELDQHLVMGVNDLDCDTWDRTFGKVYKAMIDGGLQSIMMGHIALPSYSRKLRPGIKDEEIMPATLAPELLQDLLRGRLGFNGLILTDASHMAGMTTSAPRRVQVPGAIAAGADMYLYFNDHEEDFQYMMAGYKTGIITPERLDDALHRILGLKASLGLHRKKAEGTLIPPRDGLSVIGCKKHISYAEEAARHTITLVKDTARALPITPATHPRLKVYVVSSTPQDRRYAPDPVRQIICEELEKAGFKVTVHKTFYDMERENPNPYNRIKAMAGESAEAFRASYDAALIFVNIKGYAQENTTRLRWASGHSNEIPWYVKEVPTVAISLNYTTHLLDLPMMQTYINAYAPTRIVIRSVIRKIMGKESFEGVYNETVFCGRWDTRR